MPLQKKKWQFWIDRGGTFTDIVARRPDGNLVSAKHLSDNPEHYDDAAVFGIRRMLGVSDGDPFPEAEVEAVKMGTTVGTNALLEHRGERVALLVTSGFAHLLHIGHQQRRSLFSLKPERPEPLYEAVHEVVERLDARGNVLIPLDESLARKTLSQIYQTGIRSLAIVLLHGYRYCHHEARIAAIARDLGFENISASHKISPSIKAVGRGDTTVVDAYLSPLLHRYISRMAQHLRIPTHNTPTGRTKANGSSLMFMQSHGGLVSATHFLGKDSILSGPAGGIVGAVRTCASAGFNKIITFDMGGTSTDVAHYNGEFELSLESEIAGVRLQCPMLNIHTVAAGGGSVLKFDDNRCQVGPESAGANPGPASYRKGGPLTVTDCNLVLGRLLPHHFPTVFGPNANAPLDVDVAMHQFDKITQTINQTFGTHKSVAETAEGFLDIAVENMAQAIKRISVQQGYNVKEYTLCCFGGAGAQHACKTADLLGMEKIFIHPQAGVLSALGMGLADNVIIREKTVLLPLCESSVLTIGNTFDALFDEAQPLLSSHFANPVVIKKVMLRYDGSESSIAVAFTTVTDMQREFEKRHRSQFGFIYNDRSIQVAAVVCEVRQAGANHDTAEVSEPPHHTPKPTESTQLFTENSWRSASVFARNALRPGATLRGPAIVTEPNSTIIVEPGWEATLHTAGYFILQRHVPQRMQFAAGTKVDPVMLELFNNRYMNVAEQMGTALQNTAASVNIRERLDFSCAVFDATGDLIANAPHIPVHLGSMAQSVKAIINKFADMQTGESFLLNSPYHGGTHLPDLTVITPIFLGDASKPLFYVASRGHHADIGGITPGSIPARSVHIDDEGVLFDGIRIAANDTFFEEEIISRLNSAPHPARDIQCNVSDLKAQLAANAKGASEILALCHHFSEKVVRAYMSHVKHNAEASVRNILGTLHDGAAAVEMDTGDRICVSIYISQHARTARVDFTGTSPQNPNHNFNAPLAITHAAVLYVFRTLTKDIPLNSGCLTPIEIIVPNGTLLNPAYPAAVVAGNVETSQHIVDALLQALGKLAGSQGTMNNLTFGNANYQYYETICGGSGAGDGFNGTDAIQCHMTNSRITDPEILESRFPVVVERFSVRPQSGGAGKFSGGSGAIRAIRFNEKMTASIVSSHRINAPRGLFGGEDGRAGKNILRKAHGAEVQLKGCDSVEVSPGDVLIIETPGGGGFGKS